MSDQEQLSVFLAEQKYMVVAVTLDDGTPWAVPVRIKTQFMDGFEWESKTDTEHSKAIASRPIIAITIYTPDTDNTVQFGFYAKAEAKLVHEHNGVGRYQAVVKQAWINDATFVKRAVNLL